MIKINNKSLLFILATTLFLGCDKQLPAIEALEGTQLSFVALKDSTKIGIYRFRTSVYVEAYVVSSDTSGHFFGKIVLQENDSDTALGLLVATDLFETSLWYPEGQKVRLYLKDLYVDQKTLGLSVGHVFSSFGNLAIGRLPILFTQEQLVPISGAFKSIGPKKRNLLNLSDNDLQTLVKIDSLIIGPESSGLYFANEKEETIRVFYAPDGQKININNSGYADFWDSPLPDKWVSIKGVLSKVRSKYELEIRYLSDIQN